MGEVLDLSERAWRGDLGEINIHPGRVLVGFEEFDTGLGFMSAFSNVCVLDTDEGLVFVDTSSFFHAAKLFEQVRAWSKQRVHTAVYTHENTLDRDRNQRHRWPMAYFDAAHRHRFSRQPDPGSR